MVSWRQRRRERRLALELRQVVGREAALLVQQGRLSADCADEAVRTALPIALEHHLAVKSRPRTASGSLPSRYAQLIVALSYARPSWRPGQARRDTGRPAARRRARASTRHDRDALPTVEFVAALWGAWSLYAEMPAERVDWAFRYYTRFRRSPDRLDPDIVREAELLSEDHKRLRRERVLDSPQLGKIRAALRERGCLDVRNRPAARAQLQAALAYVTRFSRESRTSEDELIRESAEWALDITVTKWRRPIAGHRNAIDHPQAVPLRAALLAYGAVTPVRLRQAVDLYDAGHGSIAQCAKRAAEGAAPPLWYRRDRYWATDD